MESTAEAAAREHAQALHRRCEALLDSHPVWKKRTLLMRLDQPSVTILRGKSRWQILFKLLVHKETEAFAAELTAMAREEAPGVDTYFEYNPTTMM